MKRVKLFDVNVYGEKIPVYRVDDLGENLGEYHYRDRSIVMDGSLKLKEFKETLAHEMFHALIDILHIQIDRYREEELAEQSINPVFKNFEVKLTRRQLAAYKKHYKN